MKKFKFEFNTWTLVFLSLFITFALITSVFVITRLARPSDGLSNGGNSTSNSNSYVDLDEKLSPISGLLYTLINDDTEYSVSNGGTKLSGKLIIPEIHEGKSVTAIDANAFSNCYNLTTVIIPECITVIGEGAFSGSNKAVIYTDLIDKPSGWAAMSTPVVYSQADNDYASDGYIYCITNGIRYALKSDTAVIYGVSENIESVNLLSTITYKNVTYSITAIGDYAFRSYTKLKSITITSGISTIGENAFSGCTNLENVIISNSSIIKYRAFAQCTGLKTIIIPRTVVTIGEDAFVDCVKLTILASATDKPDGWDKYWNYSNCPVEWGYE